MQVQRISPLSWQGAWQHIGRHSAGEVVENCILIHRQQAGVGVGNGGRKRERRRGERGRMRGRGRGRKRLGLV